MLLRKELKRVKENSDTQNHFRSEPKERSVHRGLNSIRVCRFYISCFFFLPLHQERINYLPERKEIKLASVFNFSLDAVKLDGHTVKSLGNEFFFSRPSHKNAK